MKTVKVFPKGVSKPNSYYFAQFLGFRIREGKTYAKVLKEEGGVSLVHFEKIFIGDDIRISGTPSDDIESLKRRLQKDPKYVEELQGILIRSILDSQIEITKGSFLSLAHKASILFFLRAFDIIPQGATKDVSNN